MTRKTARFFVLLALVTAFSLSVSGMAMAAAAEQAVKGAAGAAAGATTESAKDTAKDTAKGAAPKAATKAMAPAQKANINTAKAKDLAKVPGVGAKTASAIVSYREKHGPFKSLEELKQIKGIGEKKYDKLKDKLTVE